MRRVLLFWYKILHVGKPSQLLTLLTILRAAFSAVVTARSLLAQEPQDCLLVLQDLSLKVILGVLDHELVG